VRAFKNTLKEGQENTTLVNNLVETFINELTASLVFGFDLNEDPVFRQKFVKQIKGLLQVKCTKTAVAALTRKFCQ